MWRARRAAVAHSRCFCRSAVRCRAEALGYARHGSLRGLIPKTRTILYYEDRCTAWQPSILIAYHLFFSPGSSIATTTCGWLGRYLTLIVLPAAGIFDGCCRISCSIVTW